MAEVLEAEPSDSSTQRPTTALFQPYRLNNIVIPNRVVMGPMTRRFSPKRVPGPGVAEYYIRRAEGGAGLLITEGTYIDHKTAGDNSMTPFIAADTIEGWRAVTDGVHRYGSKMFCQLWHIGQWRVDTLAPDKSVTLRGPSGYNNKGEKVSEPMPEQMIEEIIEAYGRSAAAAKNAGFDGVEVHGAHGYLPDQFFWDRTNRRTDKWGGDFLQRTRFGVEVIKSIRRQVGPDYPISLRYSQWKTDEYSARLVENPQDLEKFLAPLVDAGVDMFDCSTRYYWITEFPGSDLTIAGWTRKITGKTVMTVGSVGLAQDVMDFSGAAKATNINRVLDMLERGDFDLVGVARLILADWQWPRKAKRGAIEEMKPFIRDMINSLSSGSD